MTASFKSHVQFSLENMTAFSTLVGLNENRKRRMEKEGRLVHKWLRINTRMWLQVIVEIYSLNSYGILQRKSFIFVCFVGFIYLFIFYSFVNCPWLLEGEALIRGALKALSGSYPPPSPSCIKIQLLIINCCCLGSSVFVCNFSFGKSYV